MVKVHKRNKRSRVRGSKTQGYGFRKKHKGHGNKGGFGMSGTGKRASHTALKAIQLARKMGFDSYFGKRGFTSASKAVNKYEKINLADIKENFFKKQGDKINLAKHKILGEGEGFKAEIIASSASKSAIAKMEKAGGKIILPVVKEKVVEKKEIINEEFSEEPKKEKKPSKKDSKPKDK